MQETQHRKIMAVVHRRLPPPVAFPSSSELRSRCCCRVSRSAPEADVAHALAGGAALCGGEVDLAAGADAHLEHGLFPGRRRRVDAQREAAEPDGAGV